MTPPPPSVLVPDGDARSALALARSLGRAGCRVIVGAPRARSLAGASRCAAERFVHPDPASDPAGFVDAIIAQARRLAPCAIVPPTDATINPLVLNASRLPAEATLVAARAEQLAQAHDKIGLMERAAGLGVAVPAGIVVTAREELEAAAARVSFPAVIKPRVSRRILRGRTVSFPVETIESREALARTPLAPELFEVGFLLQERVPGEGRGVFVLARDGEVEVAFAHRRLREKPPWGGVSTLCESVEPEPELLLYTARLIRSLGWTGVAMVEFKWDPATRRGWLMEINGRPWGSLQLAVSSGFDVPWLWVRQQLFGTPAGDVRARAGVRLWWMLGDLDHFLIRARQRRGGAVLRSIARDVLRTREGRTLAFDTWQRQDPGPFWHECRAWIAQAVGRS